MAQWRMPLAHEVGVRTTLSIVHVVTNVVQMVGWSDSCAFTPVTHIG